MDPVDTAAGPAAGHRALLRAARRERGWSQSEAAHRLSDLASRGGPGTARPGSLKTQLSRWENGHATPAPEHRALLAELYASSVAELGLEPAGPPAGAGGADRLRAALGRASAVDEHGLVLLREQLRSTVALDHRLGTAAAHAALAAQVEQLRDLLAHCVDPCPATGIADLLARAALLAGDQERDREAPDLAWRAYAVAAEAALRAGRDDLTALADRRRERLRHELQAEDGPPEHDRAEDGWTRPDRTDVQEPPVAVWAEPEHGGDRPSVRARAEQALHEAVAAHRAGAATDAAAAAARARRLALRTGSARVLTRLTALGR